MKRIALLFIPIFFFAGCQDPKSPSASAEPEKDSEPYSIASMVTVDAIRPALQVGDRPISAEQLKTEFVALLISDPEKALIDFVDWEAVPESQRMEKLGGLLTFPYSIGRDRQYELIESKLYTVVDYCKLTGFTAAEYNEGRSIPITHLIELQYKTSENGTQTGTIDIGQRDGRFYLYPESE
ncbi:MAG: hypothetical protein R3C53_28605 [Pirellulaceae bacterium]